MLGQGQGRDKNHSFQKFDHLPSRICYPKKCVFDRSRVARRRYVFAKLTDPLISTDRGCLDCATQKVCTGLLLQVAKRPTICLSSASAAPTTDFGPVSSLCRSARDTILGWHCQGIRDQLKSTDRSVLQKHTDDLQHATCQKHTFSIKKSTTGKWTIFRKLTIFGSGL